jgi:hypothetical protein
MECDYCHSKFRVSTLLSSGSLVLVAFIFGWLLSLSNNMSVWIEIFGLSIFVFVAFILERLYPFDLIENKKDTLHQ